MSSNINRGKSYLSPLNPEDSTQSTLRFTRPVVDQLVNEMDIKKASISLERSGFSIHELFEIQVKKNPYNTALVYNDTTLTYADLNKRANKLAHRLISNGVVKGSIVALCLDRSVELFVTIIAILKTGGVYLPIDPNYPLKRIQAMLDDAEPLICLTDMANKARVSTLVTKLLCVNQMYVDLKSESNPEVNVSDNDLAYVIYTSGSTGKPKGVLLEHGGLVNLYRVQKKQFQLTDRSRILQFASISFDAATWEWIMAFSSGACLVLASNETIRSPLALSKLIQKEQVTHATLPPAVLPSLEPFREEYFESLSYLIAAGEAFTVNIAKSWSTSCRFFNAYGPTETTICATIKEYLGEGILSIGKPIENVTCFVLDDEGLEQTCGSPGELYIGGVGVARGYLNNEGLTRDKFVDIPSISRTRLYKTGDRVRRLDNGEIEFLGRCDNQIAFHGYRIEAGEIENCLIDNSLVSNAVVVVKEDGNDKTLIAYVVSAVEYNLDEAELKKTLLDRLPEYMVPAAILQLKEFPLTVNGKIDRKRLQQLTKHNNNTENDISVDDSSVECLKSMVQRILGVKDLKPYDNFYDLGGDSIKAMRLVGEIRSKLGIDIALSELVAATNINELLEVVNRIQHWTPVVPLSRNQINEAMTGSLYLVHPGSGTIDCYRDLADEVGCVLEQLYQNQFNTEKSSSGQSRLKQPKIFGIQARGVEINQSAIDNLDEMIDDYISHIRNTKPSGPLILGGYCIGGYIALEIACRLVAQGESVQHVILMDTMIPGVFTDKNATDAQGNVTIQGEIKFLESLLGRTGILEEWGLTAEILSDFTTEQRLQFCYQKCIEMDLIPKDIAFDQIVQRYTVLAANAKAIKGRGASSLETYLEQGFNVAVTHFIAESSPIDFVAEWEKIHLPGIRYRIARGNHETMLTKNNMQHWIPSLIEIITFDDSTARAEQELCGYN